MSDEHIKVLRAERDQWQLVLEHSPAEYGKEVERKIAALDAAIAALGGGWLPIESAPRDGADILGWNRWDGVLVYRPYRYGSNNQFEGWRSPLDHEDLADSPTHWRPLPAPPSKEG